MYLIKIAFFLISPPSLIIDKHHRFPILWTTKKFPIDDLNQGNLHMSRSFREDIPDKDRFVITLELVPGNESTGRAVEKVMAIATDALADGRISAVTITDNPDGRNFSPSSISPNRAVSMPTTGKKRRDCPVKSPVGVRLRFLIRIKSFFNLCEPCIVYFFVLTRPLSPFMQDSHHGWTRGPWVISSCV